MGKALKEKHKERNDIIVCLSKIQWFWCHQSSYIVGLDSHLVHIEGHLQHDLKVLAPQAQAPKIWPQSLPQIIDASFSLLENVFYFQWITFFM